MIVQFQGEDRKQAIINHFSLDIEEEEDFFEYMEAMGYSIDDDDELLEKLHLMWWSKKENQTEYDAARAYLIKEGLDPDQLVKEGLVFIKTVQENQSLRSELQKLQNDLDDALDVKNGSGPTALSRLSNELQKQKELNAELVKAADGLLTSLPNRAENYPWCEHANDLESLIKKYKES